MKSLFETVIGLEIHAELATKEKLFCGCQNRFGAPPNTLCCPVCLGKSGAPPPHLNMQAVEYAVMLGHALSCKINETSSFDRKHYEYPDLPKGYQITQYHTPICQNGYVEYLLDGERHKVRINRIHIEEDAGKIVHESQSGQTIVDHNRCGVPLVEIVTEPDMRSAAQAKACMEAVAQILRYLKISDLKMEEGSLRADVNVSVRPVGGALGARTEMKNINSFGAVARAIEYEAQRQRDLLDKKAPVFEETRRWDDQKRRNEVLRQKEQARDYHYIPEPDLAPLVLKPSTIQSLKHGLPELPMALFGRLQKQYDLSSLQASVLLQDPALAAFFEQSAAASPCDGGLLANWLVGEVQQHLRTAKKSIEETSLQPGRFSQLIEMVESGEITSTVAKEILPQMLQSGVSARTLVKAQNLERISDETEIVALVEGLLQENASAVSDYQKGKGKALGFLVGQGMKKSGGRADPVALRESIEKALGQGGQAPLV
ncbi:Asp-tRNA(Asn)/Glu-tRNA(Gln) amidotransferase subunit GatB [Ruminococcaceae bacterium OttesenSCG-928-I18]|nr:Asp-tRNA(Asn)/Glu-tRNA(Gln) amidotransferase subunit GatB [Ruminococcaceae bacterium OttesenSCG-928-I18]